MRPTLGTILIGAALVVAGLPARADGQFRADVRHRPRLAFDGRDAAHVRRVIARIDAQEQPWAGAYAALRDLVDRGQRIDHRASGWERQDDQWAVLYGQQARNGQLATAQALVGWLWTQGLDPAWRPLPTLPGEATPRGWVADQATRARATIEAMYDDWPCWRGFPVINRGIVAADSLVMHCVAFDLLAGLPAGLRGDLSGAERRLGDFAADVRRWFWLVDTYGNNHDMRVAAGLGVAALTLNRHDRYRWWRPGTWWHRPQGWMRKASRVLHPTGRRSDLWRQASSGACAEGTSYYHYAADLFLPFFFAYERVLGASGDVAFLASDTVGDLARWSVELRLPDGARPIVDNSRLLRDTTPGYFLSRLGRAGRAADRELLLWDYAQAGFPGTRGRRAGLLLAAFDPTDAELTAARARSDAPGLDPVRLLPDRGGAVLRSGWGPDAAHVLVQAQRGDVRRKGKAHESVANGAFAFYARGDHVTLDPGYYGFDQVKRTHRGEHRSMILVDGEAPKPPRFGLLGWRTRGTDTHLLSGPRTQAGPEVASAETRTEYRGATLARTVTLVEDRYLLVEDRCRARRAKTFTAQVQTAAGAPRQRPLTVQGAQVRYATRRHQRPVCLAAAASAPLSARTEVRDSSTGDGPEGHEAVLFSARGTDVTFLTAIAVGADPAAPPSVEAVAAPGAQALRIEEGGVVDLVVSNPTGRAVAVPATSGTAAFTTDHTLVIVRTAAGGAPRVLWAIGPGSVR